jgi:hypothetical protein
MTIHLDADYVYCADEMDPRLNFTDIEGPDGMLSCADILRIIAERDALVAHALDIEARAQRLRRLVMAYAADDDYEFDAAVTDCKTHGDLPENEAQS